MPPKASSTATVGTFTERETKMMATAMHCTKAPVEIDYQKFADAFGFKNANSARVAWFGVKKKIEAMQQQDDDGKTAMKRLGFPSVRLLLTLYARRH